MLVSWPGVVPIAVGSDRGAPTRREFDSAATGVFIAYGGIVEHFENIATDSMMAPVLYWVFNVLWGVAGGTASILCFACLLRISARR